MDNTKEDFEGRKTEIDHYFEFLSIFDDEDTKLQYKKNNKIIKEKIQPQFQVILIANAFLILYNLIESTVRNSIVEIYTKVEDDEITFEELSDNLQKIWIKITTDKLKENNFKPETLRDYVFDLVKDILKNETIKLATDKMDFSGNLDARAIRDLAKKIGFERSQNGSNLEKIKKRRNRLAHGEQTFYDVGKDFTVNEMNDFKNETFDYLADVINNIEIFLLEENYKVG